MSFSVWKQCPPFAEASLTPGEKIYRVGAVWVVTDQGEPTQEQVDAALVAPPALSRAEELVRQIKNDASALALLKAELEKV